MTDSFYLLFDEEDLKQCQFLSDILGSTNNESREERKIRKTIEAIKESIKKNPGAIFLSKRRTGKTEALLELLHEIDGSYLLVHNDAIREAIKDRYVKKYGVHDCKLNRIISNHRGIDPSKLLIDEISLFPYEFDKFLGATDSYYYADRKIIKIKI